MSVDPIQQPTPQQRLITFIIAFNASLLLMDTLKPTKTVQRGMAAAIAMSDQIKQHLQTADENYLTAMIMESRKKLTEVRDLIMRQAFPINVMKARKEWVETSRQLLRDTGGVGHE